MSGVPGVQEDVDGGLVEELRRHDPDAAERLVERYGGRVYGLAVRIIGVSDDAEEAAGEALVTAAYRIDMFNGESAFDSWIYRITAAAAYRRLRTRPQKAEEMAVDDVLPPLDGTGRHFEPMDDWSGRVDELGVRDELRRVLTDAIDALPPDHRTALVLHDVDGVSHRDIAEALGMDPPAVKVRVHHSRLFLRQRLSEHLKSA